MDRRKEGKRRVVSGRKKWEERWRPYRERVDRWKRWMEGEKERIEP